MTDDAITQHERKILSDFVLNESKLTQGKVVKEFEPYGQTGWVVNTRYS